MQIKAIIYKKAGISLADSKKQLVYSRLARRLRYLGLASFKEYIAFLNSDTREEQEFVNALTTNLTAFFREPHHFETLAAVARKWKPGQGKFRVWSSAASTGEEPYSIAMVLVEAFGTYTPPVEIVASDIDSNVLDFASKGVYPLERLDVLGLARKKQFFLRGKGRNAEHAKVIDPLRNLIEFRRVNLLDKRWNLEPGFDVIFCRNVMIYFDKATQTQLLERMIRLLKNDGLYIAGHSESFANATSHLKSVGKTTYQLCKPVQESGNRNGL